MKTDIPNYPVDWEQQELGMEYLLDLNIKFVYATQAKQL